MQSSQPQKEVEEIKTRSLAIRLPADHWIWEETDRRRVIEEALAQYKGVSTQYKELSAEIVALREVIENGGVAKTKERRDNKVKVGQKRDSRLKAEAFIDI